MMFQNDPPPPLAHYMITTKLLFELTDHWVWYNKQFIEIIIFVEYESQTGYFASNFLPFIGILTNRLTKNGILSNIYLIHPKLELK